MKAKSAPFDQRNAKSMSQYSQFNRKHRLGVHNFSSLSWNPGSTFETVSGLDEKTLVVAQSSHLIPEPVHYFSRAILKSTFVVLHRVHTRYLCVHFRICRFLQAITILSKWGPHCTTLHDRHFSVTSFPPNGTCPPGLQCLFL